MKTPDGQEFEPEPGKSRIAAALSMAAAFAWYLMRSAGDLLWRAARAGGDASMIVLRAVGKFIATVWRLAGALDAALWRGFKLFAGRAMVAARIAGAVALGGLRDLLEWLPSRTGRAYSAFSGVVLIIASLWIVDELRTAPSDARFETLARAPIDAADPILARVEGRYVHLSEVVTAAIASGALQPGGETLTPAAAFERGLVEAHVEQKLLSRAAASEGLHRAPMIANQLVTARDRVLASAFMEQKLAEAVTDEAVQRLYQRQADVTRFGEEVRARQIVVETGVEAEAVRAALAAGGSFETLALELSKDRATRTIGGDLGFFAREQMHPALSEAAFATPTGAYAGLFQTEHGWHVLQVTDRRQNGGMPLSAVEDGIRKFLRMRTIEAVVMQLKKDKDVIYYGETASTPPAAPPAPALREDAAGG